MDNFEEKLDDLVTAAFNAGFNAGLSFDQIISAFKPKLMVLREEQESKE